MESPYLDAGNPDVGELGAVPGLPPDVLAALEPEHVDLLSLDLTQHLGRHLGALDQRSPRRNGVAVGGEQHLVEGDGRARLDLHAGEANGLPFLRSELLALGSKNGVHDFAFPVRSEPVTITGGLA